MPCRCECRYSADLASVCSYPINFSAKSEPRDPAYLWARREVMEEEVSDELMQKSSGNMKKWPMVEPTALPQSGIPFYMTNTNF